MDALRREKNLVKLLEVIKSTYDHLIESREDEDHAQNFGNEFSNFIVHKCLICKQGSTAMYMYIGRNIADYQ